MNNMRRHRGGEKERRRRKGGGRRREERRRGEDKDSRWKEQTRPMIGGGGENKGRGAMQMVRQGELEWVE